MKVGGLLQIPLFSKCDIIHIEVFKVSSQMPLNAEHQQVFPNTCYMKENSTEHA